MMKIFLLPIFLIITIPLHAQNLGTTFSSDDLSDESSTGSLSYSYPIFTIRDGNITYPISINYTSGNGVRVNQSASEVGLGWSLSSSFITREVLGGRDLLDFGFRPEEEYTKNKKVGYYKRISDDYTINKKEDLINVDHFPDLFTINSSVYSTSFFAKTPTEIYDLSTNKTEISASVFEKTFNYSYNHENRSGYLSKDFITKDFENFKIKTDNGLLLFFNEYDISVQNNESYYIRNGWSIPSESEAIPEVSKWEISKISDLNTNREVVFYYEEYSADTKFKFSDDSFTKEQKKLANIANSRFVIEESPLKSSTRKDIRSSSSYNFTNFSEDPDFTILANNGGYSQKTSIIRELLKKRLKKISFSSGEIIFDYNLNRKDEYNEKALTNITIKNLQGKIVKKIQLNYGYFNEGIGNEFASSRLKLISIQELNLDNTAKNTTTFSYNESNIFPYKNSIAHDFAGYFNNSFIAPKNDPNFNGIEDPNYYNLNIKPSTQLYYHPNLYQYSILPFILENQDSFSIHGNMSRESNLQHSKIYSLKEITLPTGGIIKFEYELNEFNLFYQNIQGGGLRLLSKTIENSSNKIFKKINFKYLLEDGNSSGILTTAPYFGHPTTSFFYLSLNQDGTFYRNEYNGLPNWNQDKLYEKFLKRSYSSPGYSYSGYNLINYSRIEVSEEGNGKVINEYEVIPTDPLKSLRDIGYGITLKTYYPIEQYYPFDHYMNSTLGEFLKSNSNFSNYITNDEKFKVNLLKKTIIDQDNQPLILKEYEHKYYKSSPLLTIQSIDLKSLNVWQFPIKGGADGGGKSAGIEIISFNKKDYQKQYKKVSKITTTTYDHINNQSMKKIEGFTYNDYGYPTTKSSLTNENGYLQYIEYPMNLTSNPIFQKLDKINPNIVIWSQLDNDSKGFTISSNVINFREENNLIVPSESWKHSEGLEDKTFYNKYDEYGNVLEIQKENNIPTSFIWGYKKNSIIVEIVGVKYNDIPNDIITSLQSQSDSGSLNSNSFSSLFTTFPEALISCYIYDPLLGIKEKISANGFKEIYEYDPNTFELLNIKNHRGEIIKNIKNNIKNR